MTHAVLEAHQLNVAYGKRRALHDVSLQLRAGEATALIGLNGAGKSTLLRVLAGLQAARGHVTVHRPDCHHIRAAPVAYVAQRSSARWDLPVAVIDVVLTGRHHLRGFGRRYTAADRDVAFGALDQLGIAGLSRRPVSQLSGGQGQRVLLARALAQQPQVLLLDEPLAGLDAPSAIALIDTLLELRDGGLSVLCALHELHIARGVFPRTLALAGGRLVGDGVSSDVLSADGLERIVLLSAVAS